MNMPRKSTGKKAFIAVLSVICALIALLVAFMVLKGSLFFSVAQSKTLENDFASAMEWAERSGTRESDILEEYLVLRNDVSAKYPELLVQFDIETVRSLRERADAISEKAALCPKINPAIGETLVSISETLGQIDKIIGDYGFLKADIMNLMELFGEYGRLYTKGADGLNITFTVSDEIAKLNGWDTLNLKVGAYADSFTEGAEVYLLNYLIQEARGESELLRKAFAESTYAENEEVRLEGENTRRVSSIQNGNETLTLLEKDKFESYMYKEICTAVTGRLAQFVVY